MHLFFKRTAYFVEIVALLVACFMQNLVLIKLFNSPILDSDFVGSTKVKCFHNGCFVPTMLIVQCMKGPVYY